MVLRRAVYLIYGSIVLRFYHFAKRDPANYRPVSLTSQIGKIMERIIKDEIIKFLESNNLISNSQHGFRQKRSYLTKLLEFVEKVADRIWIVENRWM